MQGSAYKFFGTVILLIICVIGHTQKTDKVYLKNGDVVTGAIKSMEFAKLKFDMNGPGIIYIKWEEIVRITSDKTFQVGMQNGDILVTKLDTLFFESKHVRLNDIVEILQIKSTFLNRLEGDINLGFNYTKSSNIMQLNFSSSTIYRKPKMEASLKLNSVISKSKADTSTSQKQDVTGGYLITLDNLFYLMSTLGWERNTQLGLDNRFLLGGVGGKILFVDNHQRLLTGTGLSFNEEQFNDSLGYKTNLEGLIAIQFKKFHYSSPRISIDAQYMIYPGLSDWGRIRMNFQVNTSIEMLKDFMVGFTFYDNFDNRPSSTAASKNDYGITFNLGYQFGK